jgi:SAM-dependent methyltransferase
MGQDDFSAFERRGWETVAQPYHSYFGELTAQSNGALLDALEVRAGVRFLDVASGPGYLAAAAARRGADVVGVDFAEAMVQQARQIYPDLTFRSGNAEDLPFPDLSFDAVGISFGMLHFAHPETALAEAFRILRPGGRIAFTVWALPEKNVGFAMLLKAIEQHGRMDVPLPPGPPIFRFSDPQESERALTDTGFVEAHFKEVEQTLRVRAPETPFDVLMSSTVRVAAILQAQSPQALDSIQKAVSDAAEAYLTDGEVRVPMPCVLVSARKP